jgi:hypothetical protein
MTKLETIEAVSLIPNKNIGEQNGTKIELP